jgi:hypothetical protein
LIAIVSIVVASLAVVLLSLPSGNRSLTAVARAWTSRSALLGNDRRGLRRKLRRINRTRRDTVTRLINKLRTY